MTQGGRRCEQPPIGAGAVSAEQSHPSCQGHEELLVRGCCVGSRGHGRGRSGTAHSPHEPGWFGTCTAWALVHLQQIKHFNMSSHWMFTVSYCWELNVCQMLQQKGAYELQNDDTNKEITKGPTNGICVKSIMLCLLFFILIFLLKKKKLSFQTVGNSHSCSSSWT